MKNLQIFDCEQYSEAWWLCRLGIPTASMFATVMAQGRKKGEPSLTRAKYIDRLAAERYRNSVCEEENVTSVAMERGLAMEAEACEVYSIANGVELQQVGFYRDDDNRCGCSPDRLVKGSGLVSIKTAKPSILTSYIRKDVFPAEHKAQSQGELWITGEPWLDLVIYYPGMPLFIKRCEPDQQFISELTEAIREFNAELDEAHYLLCQYGQSAPSTKDKLRASVEAAGAMLAAG